MIGRYEGMRASNNTSEQCWIEVSEVSEYLCLFVLDTGGLGLGLNVGLGPSPQSPYERPSALFVSSKSSASNRTLVRP
jgi:hypothetical protein